MGRQAPVRRTATVGTVVASVVLSATAASYAGTHRPHPATRPRPAAEHVPATVDKANVSYRQSPAAPPSKHRTVHGAKARALVHSFNHLAREPKNYVTCDIAGGPIEMVVFRTTKHVWRVQQSPCSEVQVTRDNGSLPTLISDPKWSKAVAAALGTQSHSHPTRVGNSTAIAEAKAVLAHAPRLPDAVVHHDAPVARLRQAPSTAAYDALVVRTRWWTVGESAEQAYADLTARPIADFTNDGHGSSGGPQRRDTIYDSSYAPDKTPHDIAYAELQLAVTPTGHHTAAIGGYGQAVPRPHRPASESVPTSVHNVLVTKVRGTSDKHPLQRTVHGRLAKRLVTRLNAAPVEAPGTSTCAEDHGQSETASFRSRGNVWVASIGPCPGIAVVRDGKALPTLESSRTFSAALGRALR